MTETIHAWEAVASDYRKGLVLGNGASIAFDRRFSYQSLREEAARRGLISPDVQLVFDKLHTTDFELVLQVLWHAKIVNDALGLHERRTARAYISVKEALIKVVRAIHPSFSEVNDRLNRASKFMQRFKTVIALNYDSLVYWAMQVGNENQPNRFKDCFISSDFQHDWRRFRKPHGKNKRATLVFYPHGNIVLGTDIFGTEQKISSGDSASLLGTILEDWRKGTIIPLFVSEGTTDQKRTSMRRSTYLSTVFEEVLPAIGSTVVLHGWSLREGDDHLLDALCRERPERFAVGADPVDPDVAEYCGRVRSKLERRLGRGGFELVFYDRGSPGCWVAS